jgi:hypothetical protein
MPRRRTVKALSPGRRKGATNSAIRYLGEIGDTWRDNGRLGRRSLGCRQGITRQCHAPSPILAVPDNRDGHMYRIDACRRQMGAGVSIGVSIRSTRRPSRPRDKFYVAGCEVYCKEQTWRPTAAGSTSRWNLGEPTIESWQRKQDCGWSTKIAPDFVATLHGVDEFDHNRFRHERSRGTTRLSEPGHLAANPRNTGSLEVTRRDLNPGVTRAPASTFCTAHRVPTLS